MKTILLKIEYDGTRFKGWQIQPNAITVEETITQVLRQICQCEIHLRACSRTDSGVHARGQVATVQVPDHLLISKLFASLNAMLPEDISISDLVEVAGDFSARRENLGKRYIYQIYQARAASALHHRYFHWVKSKLDLEAMADAGRRLEGTHDFSAFRGKGCQQISTEKTIQSLDIESDPKADRCILRIVVQGDGFLKNMVRIIAGTLIDIGRGRLSPITIEDALATGNRDNAGLTAPAKGLFLDTVFFEPDPFMQNGLNRSDAVR